MIAEDYIEDIQSRLASRAEEVCRHLLPGGKRSAKRWLCGDTSGSTGTSMDVELEGDKAGVWRDRATDESGRLLNLWMKNRNLSFREALQEAASFLGASPPEDEDRIVDPTRFIYTAPPPPRNSDPNEPPPYIPPTSGNHTIDWQSCVAAMDEDAMASLSEWRGISLPFIQWLHSQELIGLFRGRYAFPVHNAKGEVIRIHYRLEKNWAYEPKSGSGSAALVIGNPVHSAHTLAFESQWDAMAVLDVLHAHLPENEGTFSAIITRGATSNTDFSKLAIPHLIACPQNDPPEKASKTTGRTPAEEWLHKVQSSRHRLTEFAVFELPEDHKDHNDWLREEKPDHFDVFQQVIQKSGNPIRKTVKNVEQLYLHTTKDDPDAIIGYQRRFLSKGGSWLIIGPSGIGKSTLTTGLALHAAAGVEWHGITFRRPLNVLVVQAENDTGDLAEMIQGALNHRITQAHFSEPQRIALFKNLCFEQCADKTGPAFCRWLEEIVREVGAELVIVDPLLSYVGDDLSQQKVASSFLRNNLQPVLQRTGVIGLFVHHTGKPPKDAKAMSAWTDSDFSYLGLGSSELVNWARAVSVIVHTKEKGIYAFKMTKRGSRSGLVNQFTRARTNEIFLCHGTEQDGLVWLQTKYTPPENEEPATGSRRKHVDPLTVLPAIAAYCTKVDALLAIGFAADVSQAAAKKIFEALLLAGKLEIVDRVYVRKTV
jgi:energy-coupling factor transporter ATP-binding protein EcfA2